MRGAVLVFNVLAFLLVFLGALLRKTKAIDLVPGYEPEKTTDPEALARCAGTNLIVMGALILAGNFTGALFPGAPVAYTLGFTLAVIAVFSLRAVAQCRKYEREK